MFARHGVPAEVKSAAKGGTTACQWAGEGHGTALIEATKELFPHLPEGKGPDFVWYDPRPCRHFFPIECHAAPALWGGARHLYQRLVLFFFFSFFFFAHTSGVVTVVLHATPYNTTSYSARYTLGGNDLVDHSYTNCSSRAKSVADQLRCLDAISKVRRANSPHPTSGAREDTAWDEAPPSVSSLSISHSAIQCLLTRAILITVAFIGYRRVYGSHARGLLGEVSKLCSGAVRLRLAVRARPVHSAASQSVLRHERHLHEPWRSLLSTRPGRRSSETVSKIKVHWA